MNKPFYGWTQEVLCFQLLAAIECCQTPLCLASLLVTEKLESWLLLLLLLFFFLNVKSLSFQIVAINTSLFKTLKRPDRILCVGFRLKSKSSRILLKIMFP